MPLQAPSVSCLPVRDELVNKLGWGDITLFNFASSNDVWIDNYVILIEVDSTELK
jgi:hypothetical protein